MSTSELQTRREKKLRDIDEEERLTADFVNNFELPKEAEDATDTGAA